MKKKIIFGSIFAVFLLIVPSFVNASNITVDNESSGIIEEDGILYIPVFFRPFGIIQLYDVENYNFKGDPVGGNYENVRITCTVHDDFAPSRVSFAGFIFSYPAAFLATFIDLILIKSPDLYTLFVLFMILFMPGCVKLEDGDQVLIKALKMDMFTDPSKEFYDNLDCSGFGVRVYVKK